MRGLATVHLAGRVPFFSLKAGRVKLPPPHPRDVRLQRGGVLALVWVKCV